MQSFTDNAGREWKVDVNGWTLKHTKEAADVLLTEFYDDNCKLGVSLASDFVLLIDVLWCLCDGQAKEQGVTEQQFAESLGGDALGSAAEALVRAINDFFTSRDQREAAANLIDVATEMGQKVRTEMMGQMATELEKMKAIPLNQMVETYIASCSSSLPSPELPPGDTRWGS